MNVGDKFTMPIRVRRPWWAIWRPAYRVETREFVITATYGSK